MDKSKLVGHTNSLNKNLQHYLSKFEKNQQWADVAPLLMKIEGLLKQHPSPLIDEKVQLAKRLAQCLNPQLTSPLHISVLKIYDQIFKNMINYNVEHKADYLKLKLEDMAIFSVGFFPFFQHASTKVKPLFLEIIQRHYIPLGRELIPMISGLVSSIISGLDDQNENIQKAVMQTLEQANQAVGRRYLIGAVWMNILRISRCRPAGIKYLQRAIEKMPQEDEDEPEEVDSSDIEYSDDEEDKKKSISKEASDSPQKQKSIGPVEQIEDDKILESEMQISQADLKSAMIDTEEILKKDEVRQRLLEELEENIDFDCSENSFPNKSTLVLNAILACLEDDNQLTKRLMLDFMYTHLKLSNQYFNEKDKLVLVEGTLMLLIRKDLSVTRRVNQWLFGKPDIENKYQLTEKNKEVIEFLVNGLIYIFKSVPTDAASSTFPIKLFQNFYMEHDHMLDNIIPSISQVLLEYIYKYSSGYPFSPEVLKAGKRLIESTASHLALLVQSVTNLTMGADNDKTQVIINIVQFFFEHLLDSESFEAQQIEALIKTSVANLLRALCNLEVEQLTGFSSTVLTSQLALQLLKLQENLKVPQQTDFGEFDQALVYFGGCLQVISQYIANNEACQRLYKNSCEILIKGQRYRTDKVVDRLPDWFPCITKVIKDDNPSVALLAIENMIELLISEKIDPIYGQFKNLIIEESRSRIQKNQMIQGLDYTRLTLEKLWSLLDYQVFHDKIIDMIVNLSKTFPQLFTDVVAGSFNSGYIAEKEDAIRRFAVFWKLTSNYYKAASLSRELQDLNKVGLFIMLDFLEHDNPMIRHTAKNWLLESMPNLNRILDPLFEVLVQSSSSFYVTDRNQILFSKVYDTRRTNEAIKKLKSILATYSDLFISYMQYTDLSDFGNDVRLHFTTETRPVITKDLKVVELPDPEQMQPLPLSEQLQHLPGADEEPPQNQHMTYLDLLAIICLRYIQGQAIESISVRFFSENAAVNASACEFIELLVIHIDNPIVSLRLTEYIMPPLQIVLYHAVENKDLVMQVQLLNLFKVVFFHSQFRRKPTPNILKDVQKTMTDTVSNEIFLPTLISGMSTHVLYVRAQYIQFISTCIPLLAEFLSWQTLTNCVKAVLQAYFEMIKRIVEAERNIGDQNSMSRQGTFEYLQGSQHEISSVLAGVKMILKHILGLEERDDIKYDKPVEKGLSVGRIVKTVLTFGLSNVTDPNRFSDKPVFQKFPETCEQIMLTLPNILELYINCWDCSEDFLTYSRNSLTAFGCDVYTFEKYNNFNKTLPDQFKGGSYHEKNLVKPQILTMMKPLFMHYSRQFISAILQLWNREIRSASSIYKPGSENGARIVDPLQLTQNLFLQKTIELLVMMNCPSELVLDSFLESEQMKEILKYYSELGKKGKKQAVPVFNFNIVETESSILHFLYNYFKYVYIDPNNLKKENLLDFWSNILNVTRQLAPIRNPSTNIWLLELILLLTRKYSPKEIVGEQKIRNELHEFINEKLKFLASFGARQIPVQWNDIVQPDKGIELFRTILPFNPSVYEVYNQVIQFYSSNGENVEKENGIAFEVTQIEQLMFGNLAQIDDEELITRYRLFCIRTLRKIGLEVLQNSYAMEKTDRVVVRTKEFMDILFPLMMNKSPDNQIYVQVTSELLYTLLEKARNILIKAFRGNILDIFNKEDFFILNRRTLKYWENIINWVVILDKSDLFSEYLDKVTLQSYFFSKENDDNKKRIKSVERICFVIFSGERDRYTKKLFNLIEKISEVIKSDNVHPSLLILILFCVRILILRLSVTQLSELFRNIWPMLLTMLIQIFSKGKEPHQPQNKNINLVLAALKLIEMISLTHQEDFFLNQWVFMYDYFGLKFDGPQPEQKKITPFQYQPYFSNFINASKYTLNYKNQPSQPMLECKKKKRTIIVQQVKVENEAELEECALKLCQYLIQLNELRTEVDLVQVEELIQEDFIHLDEFIFKI